MGKCSDMVIISCLFFVGRVMGLAVDCSLHRLTWTPHDEDQEDIDWIQLDYICENSSVSNVRCC